LKHMLVKKLKQADQVMDHKVKSQVEEELRTHNDLLAKLRKVHPHQEMPSKVRDEMKELLDRLDVIMADEGHKQMKLQQDPKKKSKSRKNGVNMQQLHVDGVEQIAEKAAQETLQEAQKKGSVQDEKEVLALAKQAATLALKESQVQVASKSKAEDLKLDEQKSEAKQPRGTEKPQQEEAMDNNKDSKGTETSTDPVVNDDQQQVAEEDVAEKLAKQKQQLHAMLKKIQSSGDDVSVDKTSKILEQHQQLLQHLVKTPKEDVTETLKEVQAVIANIKANMPHKVKDSSLEKHASRASNPYGFNPYAFF